MKRLKIQTIVVLGSDGSINDFWEFYKVEFDFGRKTSFHPYDMFCHHTNRKNRCRETFVSKVEKELNDIRFSKLGKFSDLA
jgi:hypothetical protein